MLPLELLEFVQDALFFWSPLDCPELLKGSPHLLLRRLAGLLIASRTRQDDDFRRSRREILWKTNLYLMVLRNGHLHLMSLHSTPPRRQHKRIPYADPRR